MPASAPEPALALQNLSLRLPGGLAGAFTLWLGPRFWRSLPIEWQGRTQGVRSLWSRRRSLLRQEGVPHVPRFEAQDVGTLYGEILRLSGQARGGGAFYTPFPLARRLAAMALGPHLAGPVRMLKEGLQTGDRSRIARGFAALSRLHVADLAVGGGVFLLAALAIGQEVLDRFRLWARQGGFPWTEAWERRLTGAMLRRLWGVDLDPLAVGLTGYLLSRRSRGRGRPRLAWANALLDAEPSLLEPPASWSRRRFAVIIGNPPWEALKPSRREFFLLQDPELSELPRSDQEAAIACLLKEPANRAAYARYEEERRALIARLQHSGYPLQKPQGMRGTDANLWKYFLERTDQMLADGGSFGLLLPQGVVGDMGATALRERIFTAYRQVRFFTANAGDVFFPGIRQGYVLLLARRESRGSGIYRQSLFHREGPLLHGRGQGLSLEEIRRFSPRTLTPPEAGADGRRLLAALGRFPSLGDAPWGISFGRELHLTDHRDYFGPHPTPLPLWEGKGVEPLRLAGKARLFVRREAWQRERRHHPRNRDGRQYRLVWRDVMGQDFERLKATLIPPGGVLANTLNYLLTPLPREPLLYLLGVLVSRVAAYRLLGLRTSNHINTYVVAQLEVPPWQGDDAGQQRIVELVSQVLGHDWRLRSIAGPPSGSPTGEDSFWQRLDRAVADVYGLGEETVEAALAERPAGSRRLRTADR